MEAVNWAPSLWWRGERTLPSLPHKHKIRSPRPSSPYSSVTRSKRLVQDRRGSVWADFAPSLCSRSGGRTPFCTCLPLRSSPGGQARACPLQSTKRVFRHSDCRRERTKTYEQDCIALRAAPETTLFRHMLMSTEHSFTPLYETIGCSLARDAALR